jgi:hypothetical protein
MVSHAAVFYPGALTIAATRRPSLRSRSLFYRPFRSPKLPLSAPAAGSATLPLAGRRRSAQAASGPRGRRSRSAGIKCPRRLDAAGRLSGDPEDGGHPGYIALTDSGRFVVGGAMCARESGIGVGRAVTMSGAVASEVHDRILSADHEGCPQTSQRPSRRVSWVPHIAAPLATGERA